MSPYAAALLARAPSAWTLLLLGLVPQVLGKRLVQEERTGELWENGNLGMKLFTWNSGLQDLQDVSDRLFRRAEENPNIEVVAVCQTEGEKPMKDFVDEKKWMLVGHGEHWGVAGGKSNAQMLSVFYRQPTEGPVKVLQLLRPPEKEWKVSGKGWKGYLVSDKVMQWATIPGTLHAETERHMTSATGKGGVSVKLTLEAQEAPGKKRKKLSVAVVCGHLDSESESKRDEDFLKLLRDGSRRKEKRVSKEELWDVPSLLFDNGRPENDPLDAVVIFGDLNYRIKCEGAQYQYDLENDEDMAELMAGSRRFIAAQDDQLNPKGSDPKLFVQDVEKGGFGLRCSQPHEMYLPTYKRFNTDACLKLAKSRKGASSSSTLSGPEKELVKMCYVGKLEKAWKLKEQDKYLQAGWLDRFCFRSTDSSKVQVFWSNEQAWEDLAGSDHVAVEGDLSLVFPSKNCEKKTFPDGATVVRATQQGPEPTEFTQGETMKVVCPEGKFIVDADGQSMDSLEIVCEEDWERSMPECKSRCELPPAPNGGSFVIENLGKTLWEGDQVGVECQEPYLLVGSPTFTCPEFESIPGCYKDLNITLKDFRVSGVHTSKVNKAKVKVFPLTKAQTLKVTEDYSAKLKGSLSSINGQSMSTGLTEALKDFIHVELCEQKSWSFGSSCKSYAASVPPRGDHDDCRTCLKKFVEELAAKGGGDQPEQEVSMEVELKKSSEDTAAVTAELTLLLKIQQ